MRVKNAKIFRSMLGAFLIFAMALGLAASGMIPAAEAKTSESAPAENIFFYVANREGKNVLLDVMSFSELDAKSHGQLSELMTGTDTGKNYYFSCTDNLPTTSYTEARGFTLPELIAYVKEHSPVAEAASISYAGSDRLYFMATDSSGAYNRNWAYDQLYGEDKYYFPALFTSWSSDWEISDGTYGPTDADPIPLDIYNSTYKDGDTYYDAKRTVLANGQPTVPILATKLEMDRISNLSAKIAANSGNVTGCLKDDLTADRALQLCIPQSEAILMSGNRTAYHYFAWIYNMKLVMAEAPDIASLGTVEAPTAAVTQNGNILSITMNCATDEAQIYYSFIDGAPQTLYTPGETVTWDIGSRDLASNPVTFTMTAVKPGYDDAGIVSVTYPQRAPAFTDIYTATVGSDVTFTAAPGVSSDAWSNWRNSITSVGVKYPKASVYTVLGESQYTLDDSAKTITFPKYLFSTYGTHSFQICADGYANKNISLTMKKAVPAVETRDYYLGSDIVLSFADTDYQAGIAVSVKAEGASSSVPIGSAYVKQNVPGRLTIDKTYFDSANCAVTVPGTYILTLTNSNYDPSGQTVPIIVKAASEKPEGDNFAYTLTPGVSKGKVGEPFTVNVALASGADSYKFYAGEYRVVLDNAALTLDRVTTGGKWKNGVRTANGQTILTFAALDETDEGVAGESAAEIGSFTLTPLQAGTALIQCAKALLTDADAQALSNVEGDSLQIAIEVAADTVIAESGKDIAITGQPVTITVPSGVTDSGITVTQNTALPTVKIESNRIDITIPQGTQVNGSDTIKLPEIRPGSSVNVPEAKQVDLVVKIGSEAGTITFTKPVRLVLKDQGNKSAGFIDNQNNFKAIQKLASLKGLINDTDADAVKTKLSNAGVGEGAVTSGNDLIIWTNHFTRFIAYTPKTGGAGGGGGPGGGGSSTPSYTIDRQGGTIKTAGAEITFPAEAVNNEIKVTVKKLSTGLPAVPEGYSLMGEVYEISSNTDTGFRKPVTITLPLDQGKIDLEKQEVSLYCWNNSRWEPLSQIKLEAGKISGETEYFSKFAVLSSKKAAPEEEVKTPDQETTPPVPAQLKDLSGHWAQGVISELIKAGAISGYPDGSFRPDSSITRAEFAAVLVKALKLEPRSGVTFSDTVGHWAQVSIETAAGHGIVSGYENGSFGPDNLITREQMAVMIVKAADLSAGEGKTFTDAGQIGAWAKTAVAAASGNSIISGYPDGSFRPQANATRAEAAAVIVKILH